MKYFLVLFLITQALHAERATMFDGSQTGCHKTRGCFKLEFQSLHQSKLISIPFIRHGTLKLFKSPTSLTPFKTFQFEEGYWSEESKHWVLKTNGHTARFLPHLNKIEL